MQPAYFNLFHQTNNQPQILQIVWSSVIKLLIRQDWDQSGHTASININYGDGKLLKWRRKDHQIIWKKLISK